MRNVDEAGKTTARALRTFEGAPKGYWWIVGALVALASAAMLLHESGSWMLDLAPLWGASVNIRAFSCDAHSLGLVFGYAVTQINGRKLARLVGDGLFWLIFFIAQVGNVLLFYGCLTVLDAAAPSLPCSLLAPPRGHGFSWPPARWRAWSAPRCSWAPSWPWCR